MKINKVHYALMKAAMKKRIQNIYDDPVRGIRNFVDFGELFAAGKNHKSFLQTFQEELENSKSVFYPLMEKVIRDTDAELLSTMIVNLGYSSLTWGANFIRSFEKENLHNIPWLLSFDLEKCDPINTQMISDVIAQGKDLGILSYSFYLSGCHIDIDSIFKIFKNEKHCAFIIFVDPEDVNEHLALQVLECSNVFVALNMDADTQAKEDAISILAKNKCLVGGFTNKFGSTELFNKFLKDCYSLNLSFAFLWREDNFKTSDNFSDIFFRIRESIDIPVFPINFFSDIASIDRIISTEACVATITNDGDLRVINVDKMVSNSDFNVTKTTMSDIFAHVMPKKDVM